MLSHVKRLNMSDEAVIAIITKPCDESQAGYRLLCVYNRRFKGWGLPGGMIEQWETPVEALIREIAEETGLNVSVYKLKSFQESNQGRAKRVYVYQVKTVGVPRQMEADSPLTWLTPAGYLRMSPFAEFARGFL
jgi:ADP-ribose pyrophosphatase YjhB (NUDIX family)